MFECQEPGKIMIDVYLNIHEIVIFPQRHRNRAFFNSRPME